MSDTIVVQDRRKGTRVFRLDYSKILEESSVKRWIQFAALRPQTQTNYVWQLRDFLVRYAVPKLGVSESADKLLEWAKGQEDLDNVLMAIVDFTDHQVPLYSRAKAVNILRSFFHWNRLDLPPKKQRVHIKEWHRPYSRKELQSLLGYLDSPLQKAYLLCAKDSGLRMSHLLSIRWRHLLPDLERSKDGCAAIRFEAEFNLSSKSVGTPFLGPESLESLQKLQWWSPKTEQKEPVFQDGRLRADPELRVFDLDPSTISESLVMAKRKAGIPEGVQPSHAARKFYDNAILKMEEVMPAEVKAQLMGHSLGIEWHYNERDVEEGGKNREWYKKLYPLLDLREEALVKQRFEEQSEEIRELKEKVDRYEKTYSLVQAFGPDGIKVLEEIVKDYQKRKALLS